MNKRYYVFLSLALIIAFGVAIDTVVNDKSEQDEKIMIALAKKNFTNIKVFGRYRGADCNSFDIRRRFQAEQSGKVAYGRACTSDKGSDTVVTVESLSDKPDPTKLSLN